MWAWSVSREQFLLCGVTRAESLSLSYRCHKQTDDGRVVYITCLPVDRWYSQLDVVGLFMTPIRQWKRLRTRHDWVHMFTTHRPTLTLQLHNFDLFRTCRTALLRGSWQDFNWHHASRGPSTIAELLVKILMGTGRWMDSTCLMSPTWCWRCILLW